MIKENEKETEFNLILEMLNIEAFRKKIIQVLQEQQKMNKK